MKATAGCFEASLFQRLLAGQLSAAEAETVSAHLENCEPCVRTVRALPEDTLAAAVRVAHSLPSLQVEAASLQGLLAKVVQLRATTRTVNRAVPGQGTLSDSTVAPAAVPVAASIGRYRIVRELGRGGMGTVYEAEDPQLRRRVAVKVPQFSGTIQQQRLLRQRFLREARAAAVVRHPNVCQIYDVGEQDDKPFVVMEFVEGASLADRLPAGRRIKERHAVTLTVRIAEALLAVHAHGIIHRDLKPANILMAKNGAPILTDFGLARVHAESQHLTGEGALLGTPAYMAPEQAVSALGPVTVRTDLYSLGVVLFQMLTGRLPLEGSIVQIIAHHVERKPAPPPSQFRPDLDPILNTIVQKAMAYRPEDRFADLRGLVEALKGWLRTSAAPGDAAGAEPTLVPSPELVSVAAPPLPVARILPPSPAPPLDLSTVADYSPRPGKESGPLRWWGMAAALLFLAGGATLGIVILRDKNGKKVAEIEVPEGGPAVYVDKDKKTTLVTPPMKDSPKADEPREGLNEDFSDTFKKQNRLPAGWRGDAFAVGEDNDGRPCLKVNEKTGSPFVTLPRLRLKGDFSIEGEYIVHKKFLFNQISQSLTIKLESSTGGQPVFVEIDSAGHVTIGASAPVVLNAPGRGRRTTKGKSDRFRLVRRGDALHVYVNDKRVETATIDQAAEYETVSIGLTAGDVALSGESGSVAKLYNLKIGPWTGK